MNVEIYWKDNVRQYECELFRIDCTELTLIKKEYKIVFNWRKINGFKVLDGN